MSIHLVASSIKMRIGVFLDPESGQADSSGVCETGKDTEACVEDGSEVS